ncbi:phage terminase small subunit [Pseudomonas sp. GD03875]|nr:phage terminase small subunit [Pseudomonas sp. GD03875]MDH0894703.1 phage terminase small subunit [Pseudomonas sp. GD03875]
MTNPCRRHFQRVTAAAEAAAATPEMTMEGANAYELHMAQLHQDMLRLKQIQSIQAKVQLKAELLPAYAPYVEGVLSAGKGAGDEVLTTVMAWRIDTGDLAGALDIAEYALPYGLPMPDRFTRGTPCVVAEEVAQAALTALKAGGDFDRAILLRTAELTATHDMPDEARAKLHLALGKVDLKAFNPEHVDAAGIERLVNAKAQLARAIELHDKCGAKKDMDTVEKLLKKHAGEAG